MSDIIPIMPITLSSHMVKAALEGQKIQIRLLTKSNQLPYSFGVLLWAREEFAIESSFNIGGNPPHSDGRPTVYYKDIDFGNYWEQAHYKATDRSPDLEYEDCEGPTVRWSSPLLMSREFSRLTLEIANIKLEGMKEQCAQSEGFKGVCVYTVKPILKNINEVTRQ